MSPAGFEPAITASERPQTYVLERAAKNELKQAAKCCCNLIAAISFVVPVMQCRDTFGLLGAPSFTWLLTPVVNKRY
jgi:hypothetical protein